MGVGFTDSSEVRHIQVWEWAPQGERPEPYLGCLFFWKQVEITLGDTHV